jgi:hypothetical protein
MRPKERIPVVLDNINWEDFIGYLGFDNFKDIAIECKYHIEKIKAYWEADPDLRLVQVLTILNIIPNVPGMWFYLEESEYLLEKKLVKPEEILFWGTYGKDGKQSFKQIAIKDMTSEHLQACLDTQKRLSPLYKKTMKKVLRSRKLNTINK